MSNSARDEGQNGGMTSVFLPPDPELARKLKELRRRHDAGEISVDWSRKREPDCEHSGWRDGVRLDSLTQPASACRICSQGPELLNWRRYWNALLNAVE